MTTTESSQGNADNGKVRDTVCCCSVIYGLTMSRKDLHLLCITRMGVKQAQLSLTELLQNASQNPGTPFANVGGLKTWSQLIIIIQLSRHLRPWGGIFPSFNQLLHSEGEYGEDKNDNNMEFIDDNG